jgi:hypothetical protein
MKAYGGVDVSIHVFLISGLVGGEWPVPRPIQTGALQIISQLRERNVNGLVYTPESCEVLEFPSVHRYVGLRLEARRWAHVYA